MKKHLVISFAIISLIVLFTTGLVKLARVSIHFRHIKLEKKVAYEKFLFYTNKALLYKEIDSLALFQKYKDSAFYWQNKLEAIDSTNH